MKRVFLNVFLIIVSALVGYYGAAPVQDAYCLSFGTCTGGFFGFDLGILIWIMLIYTFVATLLLTTFGAHFWWSGAALIPAFVFQVTIDPLNIYILIILALIAWLLGTVANKTLIKLAPAFMAKVSS